MSTFPLDMRCHLCYILNLNIRLDLFLYHWSFCIFRCQYCTVWILEALQSTPSFSGFSWLCWLNKTFEWVSVSISPIRVLSLFSKKADLVHGIEGKAWVDPFRQELAHYSPPPHLSVSNARLKHACCLWLLSRYSGGAESWWASLYDWQRLKD